GAVMIRYYNYFAGLGEGIARQLDKVAQARPRISGDGAAVPRRNDGAGREGRVPSRLLASQGRGDAPPVDLEEEHEGSQRPGIDRNADAPAPANFHDSGLLVVKMRDAGALPGRRLRPRGCRAPGDLRGGRAIAREQTGVDREGFGRLAHAATARPRQSRQSGRTEQGPQTEISRSFGQSPETPVWQRTKSYLIGSNGSIRRRASLTSSTAAHERLLRPVSPR